MCVLLETHAWDALSDTTAAQLRMEVRYRYPKLDSSEALKVDVPRPLLLRSHDAH